MLIHNREPRFRKNLGHPFSCLVASLMIYPAAGPLLAAEPPAEIRYNAVIEAPVERVWQVVSQRENVGRWLFVTTSVRMEPSALPSRRVTTETSR